jgi:hypothetical protein
MPELTSLLERTTPADLAPVDVAGIAAAARGRTRRRRIGAGLAAVAAVGMVVGVTVATSTHERRPTQTVVAVSPDTRVLTPGMGSWRRLADAPFPAASDLSVLSDGRLLAWGDERRQFGDNEDPGDAGLRIATFDPGQATWSDVAVPSGLSELTVSQVLVAADRLLYIGMDTSGVFSGAVFDADAGTWTEVPPLTDVKVDIGSIAWDGSTLVSVRTDPGKRGKVGVGSGPHDVNDPDDGTVTLDWRVDGPVTRRWTFGEDAWVEGEPPPLSARIAVGSAFDGTHLAIVGGTTGTAGTPDEALSRGDGAVYDVAADLWTTLPVLPWRAVHPGVGWVDGRLVVAGGDRSLELQPGSAVAAVAQLADDGAAWVSLPSSPRESAAVNGPTGSRPTVQGAAAIVRSDSHTFGPQQPQGSILVDGRWETTPTQTYDEWDGLIVATANRLGNGGDRPFTVEVRRGTNDWVPTAEAPFTARMAPGVTIVGDRLYVVGGLTGPNITPDASLWVLDLSTTR